MQGASFLPEQDFPECDKRISSSFWSKTSLLNCSVLKQDQPLLTVTASGNFSLRRTRTQKDGTSHSDPDRQSPSWPKVLRADELRLARATAVCVQWAYSFQNKIKISTITSAKKSS